MTDISCCCYPRFFANHGDRLRTRDVTKNFTVFPAKTFSLTQIIHLHVWRYILAKIQAFVCNIVALNYCSFVRSNVQLPQQALLQLCA